tara:strand:- start:15074 stop:15262 length:189 start_codon:yes stop_codon:yes gene_type:complete
MNLEFLKYTDAQLAELKDEQTPNGKFARKEIRRREMVGYCDGTAIDRGTDAMGNPLPNPFAR